MVDTIYDFIRNDLMGNTTISGADNLALLLTWTLIVIIFFLFIKLGMWAFNLATNWTRRRPRS